MRWRRRPSQSNSPIRKSQCPQRLHRHGLNDFVVQKLRTLGSLGDKPHIALLTLPSRVLRPQQAAGALQHNLRRACNRPENTILLPSKIHLASMSDPGWHAGKGADARKYSRANFTARYQKCNCPPTQPPQARTQRKHTNHTYQSRKDALAHCQGYVDREPPTSTSSCALE